MSYMMEQLFLTWSTLSTQFLLGLGAFLPRLIGAVLVFFGGLLLAKLVKAALHKVLRALNFSRLMGQTPLQLALENPELSQRFETGFATLIYWLLLILVAHTTAAVLGLSSVTLLLEKLLNYLPQVLSAILVLGFGVVLAGAVEMMVKSAVRGLGMKQALWLGKISSYLVISVAAMSALSELGIAKDFITILFVGFIGSLSLATGLALGLGAKDTIKTAFAKWYTQNFETETQPEAEVEELKTPAHKKK